MERADQVEEPSAIGFVTAISRTQSFQENRQFSFQVRVYSSEAVGIEVVP